jgi:hypothetical protein
LSRAYKYRGHDNDMHNLKMAPHFLVMSEVLSDMGARMEKNSVDMTVTDEGTRKSKQKLAAEAIATIGQLPDDDWIAMNDDSNNPLPLYLTNPDSDYWFDPDSSSHAMYAYVHSLLAIR